MADSDIAAGRGDLARGVDRIGPAELRAALASVIVGRVYELGTVLGDVREQEDVQVERARAPACDPLPAPGNLYFVEKAQQLVGVQRRLYRHHGVEEVGLVGHAHRLRAVHP